MYIVDKGIKSLKYRQLFKIEQIRFFKRSQKNEKKRHAQVIYKNVKNGLNIS